MRRIAIINQKGGVGKTTTAVNLAAALAEAGQRVCVIDLDPQAHATTHLGIEPDGKFSSMYDVLVNSRPLAEVRRQVAERLWIADSDINLAAAEVELAGVVGREVILRDLLLQDEGPFDYVFMDCAPSLGVLTLNALELRVTGIILCMYESSTKLAQEVVDDLQSYLDKSRGTPLPWARASIFQTRIRRNIKLAECPSFGQSIFAYAPGCHGAQDYLALAQELLDQPVVMSARVAIDDRGLASIVPPLKQTPLKAASRD
jgi:chromosome partitioning protein